MLTPSFISLFSGGGGFDIGLESSGWRCAYASDIDSDAIATLRANADRHANGGGNLAQSYIEQADIRSSSGRNILARAGLRRGDAPLLVGGPPCQSWSSAGHQHGMLDPRGQLFEDFIRVARELDTRWLMFDNVRGLLTARGPDGAPGSALELIRRKLLAAGFQTQVALLNSADYGVAQRRVRLFVFGYRAGDPLAFPEPSHHMAGSNLPPWISLRNAIERLTPLSEDEIIRPTGRLAEQLRLIPAGSGVKSPGKRESTRPGGHWGYKQGAFVADLDRSARTVTANAQQDWIRDPVLGLRRLCPRECAALQSFPEDWYFAGKRVDQYRLIGNAVPPLLAEAVGRAMLAHIGSQTAAFDKAKPNELAPLAPRLAAAVRYTMSEDQRNGPSRRAAPVLRKSSLRKPNLREIEA